MLKRILIADDHTAIRKGVRTTLLEHSPNYHIGETANSHHTIAEIRKNKWDLVILDIEMPGRDGFEVLKQIQSEKIRVPVLVFSYHLEERFAIRVLRAGAMGFLSKDADELTIVKAVTHVLAGKKFISENVAQCLATHLRPDEQQEPHELLTDREFQVLLRIAHGLTITEISSELSLSLSAISSYRRRILDKMGMRSNAELVHYSIRKNLI